MKLSRFVQVTISDLAPLRDRWASLVRAKPRWGFWLWRFLPRVGAARRPWALRRHPFGIESTNNSAPRTSRCIDDESAGRNPRFRVPMRVQFWRSKLSMNRSVRSVCLTACLVTVGLSVAHAFPPAPHHLIYGTVRDELGNPLTRDAEVILQSVSGVKLRAPITGGLQPGVNYRLAVPLDAGVTDDLYGASVLRAAASFKIRVLIGNTSYLPIEMSSDDAKLGDPSKETRLDLTLGEDLDGDGIPDAWERALLARSGGADIVPDDDADGDGLSNLEEYLAGTVAYDTNDGFSLRVSHIENGAPLLEFMAIRGRSYSVFASENLNDWVQVPFRIAADSAAADDGTTYQAAESRVVRISVRVPAERSALRFFKLRVQ